jgi:hypothetical protein
MRPGHRRPDGWVPNQLLPPNVVQFARKLDCLIALLDATADALAATNGMMDGGTGHGIKPTIQ